MDECVDCPNEGTLQSSFSPSIVEDDEQILRAVYHENHIQDGALSTANMSIGQIIEPDGNGFSVSRQAYLTESIIKSLAEELEKGKPDNILFGFFAADTGEIRKLHSLLAEQPKSSFCVVDDGEEKNVSHALVKPSKTLRKPVVDRKEERRLKKQLRPLRYKLIQTFKKQLSLKEATQ